ncbi:hypothetical protein DCAR_0103115 [Daucus carota subsp. sativus]|uniref:NET domain-containing protein n=1 Tax=Daucus carota subsp. sativus TaxID=79200 RepID=A0AAF0W843_DAUCS|nr:hypothetical protein DCAR_0103115 [Daucus carota subsp. sativus]
MEASGDKNSSAEQDKTGPDYFGYYTREVGYLLSQAEGYFPCPSQTFDLAKRNHGLISGTDTSKYINTGKEESSSGNGALFCNALGAGISDFKKERLNALLRQSVPLLTEEVKEMEDPVIALHRIQRYKEKLSTSPAENGDDNGENPCKKPKLCSSSSSIRSTSPTSSSHNVESAYFLPRHPHNGSYFTIIPAKTNVILNFKIDIGCLENDDLQLLLRTESVKVEETMKEMSDELSEMLECKKKKLEQLLDIVMSHFRPMTLVEKQQLRKLIWKLPPNNLNRVVELIQRSQPSINNSSDEVFVDIENLDNKTLWRLYYYVHTFENARKACLF